MRSGAVRHILAKFRLLPRKELARPEERRVVRGRTRRQLLALVVLIVMASLSGQPLAMAPAKAKLFPDPDQIPYQIPLRWCALKGTKAVTDPGFFGAPNTTSVLLGRQLRASNQIWTPRAKITFRSPFPADVPPSAATFPVIDDPRPPAAGLGSTLESEQGTGPGQHGDILLPDSPVAAAEFEEARAECEEEWDHMAQPPPAGLGISMKGPIALNFGRFVDASGNPTSVGGLGLPPTSHTITGAIDPNFPPWCETPPDRVTAVEGAFMSVVDFSAVGDIVRDAQVVGHELGHVLELGHGDGVDNDGDIKYDGFCDRGPPAMGGEDGLNGGGGGTNPPPTIMHPSGISNDVTALQRGTSRGIAKVTPGSQIDPPIELVNADTLSDRRVDDAHDVKAASVDMTAVGMTINAEREQVILSHTLFGLVSKDESTEYAAFLDLDSDPTTGGRPAELGFPTRFKGAELVTRVRVQGSKIRSIHPGQLGEGRTATPTAWRFEGGAFSDVRKSGVTASVSSPVGEELPFPTFDVVSAELPADVVGHVGSQVRLQAITAGKGKDWVDVLPGEKPSRVVPAGSAVLFMTPLRFPACTTIPEVVQQPGDVVTLKAAGFHPGEAVHVILGDEPIVTEELNGAGNMSTDVAIPEETRGVHPITIQVEDSALTADCVLQIRGGEGGTASSSAAVSATAGPTVTATALSTSGGPPLVGPGTLVASLTVMAASVGALVVLLRRGVS